MKTSYDPELITHPLDVARQAAFVGGAAAIPGTATGAFYGTLKTQTPVLFSLVSGAQWFAIGSTFWCVRTSYLSRTGLLNWYNITRGAPTYPRDDLNPTSADKIRASTIAGAFTGFNLGLLFRGPRNVIPGTIMFSLFGWAGQSGYDWLDARNSNELRENAVLKEKGEDRPRETIMYKIAKSKWSPMSVLSDEQYEEMMQEKLLKVEAEIAVIDDRIEMFRQKITEAEAQRQEQFKAEARKQK